MRIYMEKIYCYKTYSRKILSLNIKYFFFENMLKHRYRSLLILSFLHDKIFFNFNNSYNYVIIINYIHPQLFQTNSKIYVLEMLKYIM